jgi:hypothetical protein
VKTLLLTNAKKLSKAMTQTRIHLPVATMFLAALLAGSAAAENQVPFKGSLQGYQIVTPIDAQHIFVHGIGTGNATQLGSFTVDIPHIVDLTTGIGLGIFTFTAANGDTLTAGFTGQGTPTTDPVVFTIVETATITGGTGRFANATGSFIVTRSFSFATNLFSGSIEGTISSPGAGKP